MLLKEVCVLDVVCCGRETTVTEAARLMRQHHSGDLIVVDDPKGERTPTGILTDRDIVVEVLGNDLDPAKTTVAQVMSSKLVIGEASCSGTWNRSRSGSRCTIVASTEPTCTYWPVCTVLVWMTPDTGAFTKASLKFSFA